jgi:hypothetical protein
MTPPSSNPWHRAYLFVQVAALLLGSVMFLFFLHVPANPYVAFALTGSAVGYAVTNHRHWLRLVTVLLAACAYFFIYQLGHGSFDHDPAWWFAAAGDDSAVKREVTMQAGIPALCSISVLVVGAAMHLTPLTYDYNLYAFDRSLGSSSFLLSKWFATHAPLFFAVSAAVYNMLPLWISFAWMWLIVQGGALVAWLLAFRTGAALWLGDGGRGLITVAAGLAAAGAIVTLEWLFQAESTASTAPTQIPSPRFVSETQPQ